jgi:glutathione S-transferase
MLELYHGGTSICSFKVRLVLEEKHIPWQSRHLHTAKLEHQTETYRAINPKLKVPAIVHDGVALDESTVINEYLDDRFPEVPLRPEDPMERARMRLWTLQLDEGIHVMTGNLSFCISTRHRRLALPQEKLESFINQKPDPAKRELARERITKGIDSDLFKPSLARAEKMVLDMEKALTEHPWLAGSAYSLADAGFTPYVNRLEELQLAPLWNHCPHLADWHARIKARPNYRPARDPWVEDHHLALMAQYGAEAWPRIRGMLAAVSV